MGKHNDMHIIGIHILYISNFIVLLLFLPQLHKCGALKSKVQIYEAT